MIFIKEHSSKSHTNTHMELDQILCCVKYAFAVGIYECEINTVCVDTD